MAIPNNSPEEETDRAVITDDGNARSRINRTFRRHLPGLTSPPSDEETRLEGNALFSHFFREQMQQAGLLPTGETGESASAGLGGQSEVLMSIQQQGNQVDGIDGEFLSALQLNLRDLNSSLPLGYHSPAWAKTGRDLRYLADRFAKSEERKAVTERANQVDIEQITWERFSSLLTELFSDGQFQQERIVTLFFFCTDIVIRAIRENISRLAHQLFNWSLRFISERVCTWVQEQGGWSVVLGTYIPKFAITVCAVFLSVAAGIYIWKNW